MKYEVRGWVPRTVASVLAAAFFCPQVSGQDFEELLDNLAVKRQQLQSLHFVTSTKTTSKRETTEVRRELWEQREGDLLKYRLETATTRTGAGAKPDGTPPEKSVVVSDGRREWRELRVQGSIMAVASKPTARDEFYELRLLLDQGKARKKAGEMVGEEKCIVLEIVGSDDDEDSDDRPQDLRPKGDRFKASFWISERYGLILKQVTRRSDGSRVELGVLKLAVNKPVEPEKFAYTPPEGATVIDVDAFKNRKK